MQALSRGSFPRPLTRKEEQASPYRRMRTSMQACAVERHAVAIKARGAGRVGWAKQAGLGGGKTWRP